MEVWAEIGGGVGGGFVAMGGVAAEIVVEEVGEQALGFEAAAAEDGGRRDGMIDLAGGDELGNVAVSDVGVEMRRGSGVAVLDADRGGA